jgi:FkbM family methyltransferase
MRNPIYQLAELRRYANRIGWFAATRLRASDLRVRAGLPGPAELEIQLKNANHPLTMRVGTSDRDVLWQIFIQEEYERAASTPLKTILDLGANVGYASVYFLSKYPDATVLAVEPDPANCLLCQKNLAVFGPRARIIQGAVWGEPAKLVLDLGASGDGRAWSTRVKAVTETETTPESSYVDSYDMPTLIELSGAAEIDLLKIDIERSEIELFSRNTESWLPCIRNLCIELHGEDCDAALFRALENYSYEFTKTGDLAFCQNLRKIQD